MSAKDREWAEVLGPQSRLRAFEAVHSVLSDDHNAERGVAGARAVAETVLAENGASGLVETTVELTVKLAEALERIAADQRLAAVDLAEVWFVN
ncbi:MAG TPA: hypothetical protein VD813_01310 [Pseudonocardia sp.]|nr:hypothetical protein [Pseudonocardia sp.]